MNVDHDISLLLKKLQNLRNSLLKFSDKNLVSIF